MQIHSDLPGSALAPSARVHEKTRVGVQGAIAAERVDMFGVIDALGFGAAEAFAERPEPVEAAVAQIAVTDGALTSRATALLTTGDIAPVAAIEASADSAPVGRAIELTAASTDANGDPLSHGWALLSVPEGSGASLTIGGATARLVPDRRGPYVVQLTSTDGTLAGEPATIVVRGDNRDPVIVSASVELGKEGEPYAYRVAASDPDGDTLAYRLAEAPAGMTIDEATGLIAWLPDAAETYGVEVLVEDGLGGEARQAFAIEVETGNGPPSIAAIGDAVRRPGEPYVVAVTAADPDGDELFFTVQGLPAGATFDAATGELRFVPGEDDLGAYELVFVASDGELTASEAATLMVEPWPEDAPTTLTGRVLDADDLANGVETPVVGATVALGGVTATTDGSGSFAFASLPVSGSQRALAEGETVLSETFDTLPPHLRSCSIHRVDRAGGGTVALASLGLANPDPLVPGTRAVV